VAGLVISLIIQKVKKKKLKNFAELTHFDKKKKVDKEHSSTGATIYFAIILKPNK
jgi:hypothetical protein